MKRLLNGLKHLKDIDEFPFKRKLDSNPAGFLFQIGVRNGQTVLDFGCGSGTFTVPAASLVGEEGTVYGLDKDIRSLEKLRESAEREGLRNVETIVTGDGVEVPLKDGEVDFVLLIDVFHEIDDKIGLLEEFFRVLKPGGVVCVYPMHVEGERVKELASVSGFHLDSARFQGHVLLFRKSITST